MGIPDKKCWVLFKNAGFVVSPTYPEWLVVPAPIYTHQVDQIARFRSKRRFPVLCWRRPASAVRVKVRTDQGDTTFINTTHEPFTFPSRVPVMLRCAQPSTGLTGTRCDVEEAMLRWVGTNTCPFNKSKNLFILDCRPKINAMANACKGGGWESEEHYRQTTLEFLDIGNIHVVRESFQGLSRLFRKLSSARRSERSADRYKSVRDALRSGRESWFEHLSSIMRGANRVVDLMNLEHVSVVIHCSDGWDRTAQVAALAQLQMDPYYRTILGFGVLIEKEFVGFGHNFARRTGHGPRRRSHADKQRSPIFVQWIDTVYQLVTQFPEHFEFNASLLVALIDVLHSCRYGNFLMDSEAKRVGYELRSKTLSFWAAAVRRLDFRSSDYAPDLNRDIVLRSRSSVGGLELFLPFYVRWDVLRLPRPIATGLQQTKKTASKSEATVTGHSERSDRKRGDRASSLPRTRPLAMSSRTWRSASTSQPVVRKSREKQASPSRRSSLPVKPALFTPEQFARVRLRPVRGRERTLLGRCHTKGGE